MPTNTYIRLQPAHFADAIAGDAQAVGGQAFCGVTECAYLRMTMTGPTLNLQIANNSAQPTPGNDLAVYVDGVYKTNVRPTSSTLAWLTATVGAGDHLVEVVTGLNSRSGTVINGSFVIAVAAPNLVILPRPTPTRILLMYGDSLIASTSGNQNQTDMGALLRARYAAAYPGARTAFEAFGFRSAADDATNAPVTDKLLRLARGVPIVDIISLIGTNDYGLNKQTAAAFQTQLAARFVAIQAAFGTRLNKIYNVTILTRGTETANGFGAGNTTPDYRTSQVNAAAGLSGITTVDGTSFGLNTSTDFIETPASAALHPNAAGALKAANGVASPMGI